MMNIREFFNLMYETSDMDYVMDYEEMIYNWYCEDDSRWDEFVKENNIDLTATKKVLGGEELVLTLWCWDMCGE